ncbi:MAG: LTA synthase family protein [Salibacteraceae bacterium]
MSASWSHFRLLWLRLGIALLGFSLLRLAFWLLNLDFFRQVSGLDFAWGLRFDLVAIGFLFAPYALLHLVPFAFSNPVRYRKWLWWTFHGCNGLSLVLNGIDLEYFKFTLKRSTADLFQLAGFGNDLINLLPAFVQDYWYVVLLFFLMVGLSEVLYQWSAKRWPIRSFSEKGWIAGIKLVVGLTVLVLAMRGGWQDRPLDIVDANYCTKMQNVPLVLNTPFTVIKTLIGKELPEPNYFSAEELPTHFDPVFEVAPKAPQRPLNVVILIVESMATEYIGGLNPYTGYTPFLDSLMDHSLVFEQCFANGRKSIEAVPAIVAGLPSLMTNPYITSRYAHNDLNSLPSLLAPHGYSSSFYHGGNNGTMGFEQFARSVGFERYAGRSEYPNPEHYDGHWGIFDEEFLQFYAQDLSQQSTPFVSALFTLSSHHPYTIPAQHEGRFAPGSLPIHQAVRYADHALKRFFETAAQQPWYTNTLFVVTADHASYSDQVAYDHAIGAYAVPLLFFQPGSGLKGRSNAVAQQTDILPSVLDYLGFPATAVSFGRSLFRQSQAGYSVSYLNSIYQWIDEAVVLHFDGQQLTGVFDRRLDPQLKDNLVQSNGNWEELSAQAFPQLKACIQSYNARMRSNRLNP